MYSRHDVATVGWYEVLFSFIGMEMSLHMAKIPSLQVHVSECLGSHLGQPCLQYQSDLIFSEPLYVVVNPYVCNVRAHYSAD